MKKILLAITFITLIMAVPGLCHAIVGACSNCHTMHNSQGGSAVVQAYDGVGTLTSGVSTPIEYLLKASCIACHTGGASETGGVNTFGAPIVLHITSPGVNDTDQGSGKTLAGGDFYWVATGLGGDNTKGHNVVGISNQDNTIATDFTPPGWDVNATPGVNSDGAITDGEGIWVSQLTCAGKYGCHGNHTETSPISAIKYSHHSNDNLTSTKADTDVSTAGKSFRFLSGIKGLEDSDWQWTESSTDHNEYFGANITGTRTDYTNKHTISYLCAECHGDYHKSIGGTSPWLRHPTDIVVPAEYIYNPDDSNQYSLKTPVARGLVPDFSSASVTTGSTTAILMCLSCHRAHGSPCYKLMRWDNQANMSGCLICHTSKK